MQRTEHELFTQVTFPAQNVQTLTWHGDVLVDWAGGHTIFDLNGHVTSGRFTSYGKAFDAVVSDPDGRYVVIYQRQGTKALLLSDDKLHRELNRSYYHAEVYEYPVGFVRLPDGRMGLAHCPDEYCRLEIDDVLTGERLTGGPRKPEDFFHSRLSGSPGGRRLLSAGWIWHPYDAVLFFDVQEALRDPRVLDRWGMLSQVIDVGLAAESAAAWLDDDHVILAASDEPEDTQDANEAADPLRLRPSGLAVYHVESGRCLSSVILAEQPGTVMPAGRRHVVAFYREPRLASLETGEVLYRWDGLFSGLQMSSICGHLNRPIPPLALDPCRGRFAVASKNSITAVQLRLNALASTSQRAKP